MMLPGGAAITLLRRFIVKNGWGDGPKTGKETSDVKLGKAGHPYDDMAVIVQAIFYCFVSWMCLVCLRVFFFHYHRLIFVFFVN